MERHRHNLPEWLVEPLKDQLGDEFWPMVQALSHQRAAGPARQRFEGKTRLMCRRSLRKQLSKP
jgi:hypothetical protein